MLVEDRALKSERDVGHWRMLVETTLGEVLLGRQAEKWALSREGCGEKGKPLENQRFRSMFVCW